MRRLGLKDVAVFATLLVLTVECTLRWGVGLGDPPLAKLDPITEYELVPAMTYHRWGNRIEINTYGMRASDHPAVPSENERRVLLIGDSVVYGGHFLDQSETISAQLGQILSEDPDLAGCRIRVLPLAVSSWGPVNQAAALQKYGPLGARTVGIIVSAHDLYDTPSSHVDLVPYRTAPTRTAIGDAVQAVIDRYQRSSQAQADQSPFAVRVELSLAALDNMADTLQSQNIRTVLIYHPTTLERAGQVRTERDTFLEWAATRDIESLDLGSVQMAEGDYRDHIHPAETGAQRIAQTLSSTMGTGLPPCLDM